MRLPRLRTLFRSGLIVRTLLRELTGIREALHAQNALLARFADAYFPVAPAEEADPAARVARDTGVSFLDPLESMLVQDYITRTATDTGRDPTDDEIATWLADSKTIDLHQRLIAREREILHRERAER